MRNLLDRADRLASRLTNRLIQRFPGPTIVVGNTTPIVSFTFDDVPDTALTNGARILEAHGVRGTFFINGGLLGRRDSERTLIDAEGCADLARRGHELGCHTFSHPNLRHLRGDQLARDVENSRLALTKISGVAPRNFAYPYNSGSFRARPVLMKAFRSARGGLNGVNRGLTDRSYLRGMPIEQPEASVAALHRAVDDLVRNPGWLIFFAHDIADRPTLYGCTPQSFDDLVAHTLRAGCSVLTVDAALDAIGAPS